jgi:orotate phosphoribosyltransferase
MSPEEYGQLLVEIGAVEIRTDPEEWFTWVSGKRSPIYCDNRVLISYPEARARVADGLAEEIRTCFPECQVIAGVATAGIPHAAWVAERLEKPMVYVRSSSKEHGKGKQVEGRALRGERVVLVEDLVSFGGSACSAIEVLTKEGGKVIGVEAIFSYGFPRSQSRFEEVGVPCRTLTHYDALLASMNLDDATARLLLEWRAGC